MIPRIVHYCWLSGAPYPDEIQRCIHSWQQYLPDYQFIRWDTARFDVNTLPWTRQAFEARKYAFAADYIRLYALYHHGGIYLDSDVLLYRSFDNLLDLPYFIGQDFVGAFEPAVIGCEPGTTWVKQVMEYYHTRNFIHDDGSCHIRNLPVVFFETLFPHYTFNPLSGKESFRDEEHIFNIFGPAYFNGRNNIEPVRRKESYCSHLFAGSWTGKQEPNGKKAFRILPKALQNKILGLNYHWLRKKKVHHYDPVFRQRSADRRQTKERSA